MKRVELLTLISIETKKFTLSTFCHRRCNEGKVLIFGWQKEENQVCGSLKFGVNLIVSSNHVLSSKLILLILNYEYMLRACSSSGSAQSFAIIY